MVHVYFCVFARVWVHACVCVGVGACVWFHVWVPAWIRVCVCVCVCVCV